VTSAERIRARNTALVQVGVAIGCVVLAALLLLVMTRPGNRTSGFPGAMVTLVLVAGWTIRRGRRGLRRTTEPAA
jgi:hypothetical protein